MKKFLACMMAAALLTIPAMSLADQLPNANADTTTSSYDAMEKYMMNGTVKVQGKASIKVAPDMATINFGVELTKDDAQTAQSDVNKIINAAVDAIKALGIDEKAIQTDSVNIYREYDYTDNGRVPKGFTASTSISVTLDDITLAGSAIDAALGAGANNVNSISFATSKQSEYYDQALAAAVENARHKADVMSSAMGCEVAGMLSITEQTSGDIYVERSAMNFASGATEDSAIDTSISAGEIEISASVEGEFILN